MRAMKRASTLALALFMAAAIAADTPTDDEIRAAIVERSIAAYTGSCPCPYNVDRAGRSCGGRSAWSRPGGRAPLCFSKDVSEEQVREYRKTHGL